MGPLLGPRSIVLILLSSSPLYRWPSQHTWNPESIAGTLPDESSPNPVSSLIEPYGSMQAAIVTVTGFLGSEGSQRYILPLLDVAGTPIYERRGITDER